MKKQDILALRKKSKKQLLADAGKKRLSLAKFKARFKAGKEKNSQAIKTYKKEISQILTIIREKDIIEKESEKESKNSKPIEK